MGPFGQTRREAIGLRLDGARRGAGVRVGGGSRLAPPPSGTRVGCRGAKWVRRAERIRFGLCGFGGKMGPFGQTRREAIGLRLDGARRGAGVQVGGGPPPALPPAGTRFDCRGAGVRVGGGLPPVPPPAGAGVGSRSPDWVRRAERIRFGLCGFGGKMGPFGETRREAFRAGLDGARRGAGVRVGGGWARAVLPLPDIARGEGVLRILRRQVGGRKEVILSRSR
jgi:hypothetical protein